MALEFKISPKIIPSVASSYTDVNRVFIEYIDNSIDSAEEYFDQSSNKYSKPIEIKLLVKNEQIIITDNCAGIAEFSKVVGQIGNSVKVNQASTNGQFGYGIFSFLAYFDLLEIASKVEGEDSGRKISIPKEAFNSDEQEDVKFDDPIRVSFENHSGTKILLSGISKSTFKQISADEIKKEIENHFETILERENLTIRVIDTRSDKNFTCEKFDYNTLDGEVYEESFKVVTFEDGRSRSKSEYYLDNPVKIFLKVTKSALINKPPIFIRKGRRVSEVKDIKQFKSAHKSDIWSHPNLTGYIDLVDCIDANITRTDFKTDQKVKAVFATILGHENAIQQLLKKINNLSEEQHYQKLEDFLNKALSKLAKFDAINFRSEIIKGRDINLSANNSNVEESFQDFGNEFHRKGPLTGDKSKGIKGGGGDGSSDDETETLTYNTGTDNFNSIGTNENPFEDSGFKGTEKKRSGFDIKLVEMEPPEDREKGKKKRSLLNGGTIVIYKKHPDFESRVSMFRDKQPKITPRLITYLAGEITVHYKDRIQNRQGQALYNIEMFEDLVEFIYKFEEVIKDLAGKNMSDLMSQESEYED